MENSPKPTAAGETDVGAFTAELSALTRRHGIQHFASYGELPNGGVVLSYDNGTAIARAHSAFQEKYSSTLNASISIITPSQS